MAKQNVSIPKGTRDFSPKEMVKRNYIFDTIREVFKKFGYLPIETPAMETIETLTGKYGEEGDQLLFKILNSRPHDAKEEKKKAMLDSFQKTLEGNTNSSLLTEKALRYDLTVPFARYVVQNQNDIQFPFKRYQIQPVWRADRPQKGRYREFYQCDADVVGSPSLLNEIELLQMLDEVFTRLGISVSIKLNNRKILAGLAEMIGNPEKLIEITMAIDKLDKIGEENVKKELVEKGITPEKVNDIMNIISTRGTNEEKLSFLETNFSSNETGKKGIEELTTILKYISKLNIYNTVEFDFTLARGLNYYTGAIIEVKANDVKIGSISGGGRYDDLTGIFGLPGVSGVGISFGADRIYDVLQQLNKFPEETTTGIKAMFVNFGEKETEYCLPIVNELRQNGIGSIIYPDKAKMKKQLSYANSLNISYVILAGENEMTQGKVTIKNMESGEQQLVNKDELSDKLK